MSKSVIIRSDTASIQFIHLYHIAQVKPLSQRQNSQLKLTTPVFWIWSSERCYKHVLPTSTRITSIHKPVGIVKPRVTQGRIVSTSPASRNTGQGDTILEQDKFLHFGQTYVWSVKNTSYYSSWIFRGHSPRLVLLMRYIWLYLSC